MKISLFAISDITPGKHNVKDPRLDEVDKITKAKKKTYVQVEVVGEEGILEADAILASKDSLTDLVLRDLEFVEARLTRAASEDEKAVLSKLKTALEKEQFIAQAGLGDEEKKFIAGYTLVTNKAVVLADAPELENKDALLARVLLEAGFISFFTTGEKETRAWLIKKGTSAWEAAGSIHSDIQRGFIRAEIISFEDFISFGGETQAKQAGKQRLEQKEYVMQECDLTNFRFSK